MVGIPDSRNDLCDFYSAVTKQHAIRITALDAPALSRDLDNCDSSG
jgi:hypothetical protein